MSKNPLNDLGSSLGEYLREQRTSARLSLRQLSELAGVSNPYLSQIERGLKRPSAEILQQLAKGLEVSAESLYVKAGILDAAVAPPTEAPDVRGAIAADPALTQRQKKTLLDIYESYVEDAPTATAPTPEPSKAPKPRKAPSTRRPPADQHPQELNRPRTTRRRHTMSVIEDLRKNVDTTPFFAAVGATDLAVEKVREARLRADKARADLAVRAEKARVELSTDLAPASVQARATKAVDDAKEIPALAINQTMVFGGKLTEAYDELAARGHKLVKRIQNQKATKDLVAQADTTVAQVKGAVTSARKATADIERSAKATITTARKEAAKVVTVVGGSVAEETKVVQAEVATSVKHTKTAAKRTNTTAKRATKKATTSAKAATTSVRKTAVAAEKATEKAAEKVGHEPKHVAKPETPAAG